MDVVAGAIERIDHPAQRWPACGMLASSLAVGRMLRQRLFTNESMIRKRPQHDPADLPLRGEIRLGDEVARPLVRHAEPSDPVEQNTAACPGRGLTHLKGSVWYRHLHGGLRMEMNECEGMAEHHHNGVRNKRRFRRLDRIRSSRSRHTRDILKDRSALEGRRPFGRDARRSVGMLGIPTDRSSEKGHDGLSTNISHRGRLKPRPGRGERRLRNPTRGYPGLQVHIGAIGKVVF